MPTRSEFAGTIDRPGTLVGTAASSSVACAGQHVEGRARRASGGNAEAGRGVALRIEIDHQHLLADRGERRAEIDGGRRLADAALLVGDGENPNPDWRMT